jgi:uncharacterized delta-60 repeat protein
MMKNLRQKTLLSHLSRLATVVTISSGALATMSHADGAVDYFYFNNPAGFRALQVEGSSSNTLTAMAIQPDGKIIVVGGCRHEVVSQFCVARLTNAGTLDPDFIGPGGVASAFMLPISANVGSLPGLNESADRVALQADGKIVIGGTCRQGAERRVCLTRLNANGSFDTTFGESSRPGRRIFTPRGNSATGFDTLTGLNILGDGRIVFSGDCAATSGGASEACATVLSADGISLTSSTVFNKLGTGSLSSQVVDSSGRVMILGSCNMGGTTGVDFCATQFDPSTMALDVNFDGGNNLSTGNGNGRISVPVGSGADYLTAAVSQPTAGSFGRTLAVGSCFTGSRYELCATSFSENQGRSFSFAGNNFPGLQTSLSTGDNFAAAVATDEEGRFVIVGQCSDGARNFFCAARYHADGTPDVTWDGSTSINPAGDGKFLLPALMSNDYPAAAAYQKRGNISQLDGHLVIAGTCTQGSIQFFCVTRLSSSTNAVNCDLDIDGDGTRSAMVDGLIVARIMLGMTRDFMTGIAPPDHARRKTRDEIRRYLVRYCGFNLP